MSAVLETVDLSLLARKYVKNGWALVPISGGTKEPTSKAWNVKANCVTTEADCRRIRANVGLAHAYSRTCVLDFDDFEKSVGWLAKHGIAMADLWDSLDAVKISSGRPNRGKLLYRLPAGVAPLVSYHDNETGIELRCATATGKTDQDLLPPSIHPETGRPYEWIFDDMLGHWSNPPELPAAVLALWRSLAPRRVDSTSVSGEGDREAALAVLADFDPDMSYHPWIHVGMALHHEFEGGYEGLELWDEWSAAGTEYKGLEDLEKHWITFDNHKEGGLHTLDTLRAKVRNKPATLDEFQDEVEKQLAIAEAAAAPVVDAAPVADDASGEGVVGRDLAPIASEKPMFQFQSLDDFMKRPAPQWIIKGFLPRAALGVLYGASGSGKSFLALDMAISVARGENWRGARTKQGAVGYIVAEGAGGFTSRVQAYCTANDIAPAEIPLKMLGGAPNLMLHKVAAGLAAALIMCGPLSVVFVDTYARVMGGGNENEAKDTNTIVANCALIHELTGALVVLIHHSGKDAAKGARGSGALKAAADVELEVVRLKDYRALTVSKMKDADDGGEYHFKLANVAIGEDEDGEELTSCVVEHIAPVPIHERRGIVSGKVEKAAFDYLIANVDLGAESVKTDVLLSEVAATMDYDHTKGKKDRRKELVKQALRSLDTKKLIEFTDEFVRLPKNNVQIIADV